MTQYDVRYEIYLDIETTERDPFRGKIVTIQVKDTSGLHIWKEWELGEEGIITKLMEYFDSIDRFGTKIIGYNHLTFDLPFIFARATKLGMDSEKVYDYLFSRIDVFDIYQYYGSGQIKFSQCVKGLLGLYSKYENKDVPRWYKTKLYENIIEYIEDEMTKMENLFHKIQEESHYQMVNLSRYKITHKVQDIGGFFMKKDGGLF